MITAESPHSCNSTLHNADNLHCLNSTLMLLKCYTERGMYIQCTNRYDIKKWWAIITTFTVHRLWITNTWNGTGIAKPHSALSPPKIIYVTNITPPLRAKILIETSEYYYSYYKQFIYPWSVRIKRNISLISSEARTPTPQISANKIAPLYHRVKNMFRTLFSVSWRRDSYRAIYCHRFQIVQSIWRD
jgi:hypothetical protein